MSTPGKNLTVYLSGAALSGLQALAEAQAATLTATLRDLISKALERDAQAQALQAMEERLSARLAGLAEEAGRAASSAVWDAARQAQAKVQGVVK